MTDQEQAVRIACEKTFEPNRRLEVEMVRRLIKEQKIGALNKPAARATRMRHPPEKVSNGLF